MKYTLQNILICFLLFGSQIGAVSAKNTGISDLKIQFELVEGLILVPLTVDGVDGIYILDSGAPSLVLNKNIEEYTTIFTAVGKEIPASPTEVDKMEFGPLKVHQVLAWEMDLEFVEQLLDRQISGLVGADFLSKHDLVINYQQQEISFITADYEPEFLELTTIVVPIPFEVYNENLPVVTLSIDGKPRKMAFDTGASINVFHKEKVNEKDGHLIAYKHLKIEKAQFVSADLSVLKDKDGKFLDGILSASSLNASKVLISFDKSTIYLFYNQDRTALVSK